MRKKILGELKGGFKVPNKNLHSPSKTDDKSIQKLRNESHKEFEKEKSFVRNLLKVQKSDKSIFKNYHGEPLIQEEFDVLKPFLLSYKTMQTVFENIEFMEEIYRIAKPNAKVIIRVPHFSGRSAWCDPTHLRAYSYYQFYYYSSNSRDKYGNCEFNVNKVELRYTRFPHGFFVSKIVSPVINFFANLNIKFCEKVWCYWVGGFSKIYVELEAIK